MSRSRQVIFTLVAGTALFAAAPAFADGWHGYYRDHGRHLHHERFVHRHHVHDFEPRRVVVVERPVVIERPVPVYEPASAPGIGAVLGAVIGGIYDSRR